MSCTPLCSWASSRWRSSADENISLRKALSKANLAFARPRPEVAQLIAVRAVGRRHNVGSCSSSCCSRRGGRGGSGRCRCRRRCRSWCWAGRCWKEEDSEWDKGSKEDVNVRPAVVVAERSEFIRGNSLLIHTSTWSGSGRGVTGARIAPLVQSAGGQRAGSDHIAIRPEICRQLCIGWKCEAARRQRFLSCNLCTFNTFLSVFVHL